MDGTAAVGPAVTASLCSRLGGTHVLAAVVDDAVDRHAANPQLAPLLRGLDLPQLKALAVAFLSASAGAQSDGGPPGLEPWHTGLHFNLAQLKAVAGDVTDALREQGVGSIEADEVVNLYVAMGRERLVAVSS